MVPSLFAFFLGLAIRRRPAPSPRPTTPSTANRYRPLVGVPGIEVRTHATTLYNSIYRADDQALVNAHVWGVNAYSAPVWHVRRSRAGSMFDTYAHSFDAVWATATPVREG